MTELIEQLERYTQALADPAAVGPDPADEGYTAPAAATHPGRKVLAACLVAVVLLAASGVVLASRHSTPAPPVSPVPTTVTGGDADISVTVETNGTELPYGSTLTVRTELTNRSDQPIRVVPRTSFSAQLIWDQPGASASQILSGSADRTLAPLFSPFASGFFRDSGAASDEGYTAGDLEGSVVLEPGDSVSYEGTMAIDETVRAGAAFLVVTPMRFFPNPNPSSIRTDSFGPEGTYTGFGPMKGAMVVIPVQIEAPPDGSLTKPDALAIALEDPEIAAWGAAVLSPGVGMSPFPNLYRDGDGWTLVIGDSGLEGEAAVKQSGQPGLIATITDDGTVTVDWIRSPSN